MKKVRNDCRAVEVAVSNVQCAASAIGLIVEKLWDDEKTPEAFLLERVKEVLVHEAGVVDSYIYSQKKEPSVPL